MKSGSLLLIMHWDHCYLLFFSNVDFFSVENYRLFQGNSYLERIQKLQYLQATLKIETNKKKWGSYWQEKWLISVCWKIVKTLGNPRKLFRRISSMQMVISICIFPFPASYIKRPQVVLKEASSFLESVTICVFCSLTSCVKYGQLWLVGSSHWGNSYF